MHALRPRFHSHPLALPLTLAALLACSAKLPKGYVMREWGLTLRELGIVPIFPPREDVQVGDIYAYPWNPEDEDSLIAGSRRVAMSPRWATLGLLDSLKLEYERRPSWPRTPDADSAMLDTIRNTVWPQATDTGNIFRGNPNPVRLRLVAFPDFSATTFAQGDLSALIPMEAFNLALGVGRSELKSVTVKVPSAESYGIPLMVALRALLKWDSVGSWMHSPYGEGLDLLAGDSLVWVRVITEVYYARALDITVRFEKASGAGASSGAPKPPAAPDSAVPELGRLRALNQALAGAGAQTVPGASLKILAATQGSVTMRRLYERGIAIGFRGLVLEVDKRTGRVLKAGPATGAGRS